MPLYPLRKFIGLYVFSLGFVHVRSYFYPLYSYTLRLLYTLKNKEVVMSELLPPYFYLCTEGFEPYLEKDEETEYYCRIKPSTPPEIRKKIEKHFEEYDREKKYQWGLEIFVWGTLNTEGFRPYIIEGDKNAPYQCSIKPSAPPEIRAKIEKRLKELHKEIEKDKKDGFAPII
jgi:hypothetical protein